MAGLAAAADLVALCRALRHQLAAGLTVVHVLRQQAERGPRGVRPLAARLHLAVSSGQGLGDALERERDVLPPLFVAMAKLGEAMLYATGSSARQTAQTKDRPVDAVIMAIVDSFDIEGRNVRLA